MEKSKLAKTKYTLEDIKEINKVRKENYFLAEDIVLMKCSAEEGSINNVVVKPM